jgi:hypothetical protein
MCIYLITQSKRIWGIDRLYSEEMSDLYQGEKLIQILAGEKSITW